MAFPKSILSSFLFVVVTSLVSLSPTHTANGQQSKAKLPDMSDVDFSQLVQPVGIENQFIDAAYNIWCGSVIKGGNGKYYMFYSRWPKAKGHEAWITNSEIALASADQPGGPYKHLKVIFNQRGSAYWDGIATHNPAAIVHKGKYYLYYMGTTGTAKITPGFAYSPAWYNYRNNQRIGVAVADDPKEHGRDSISRFWMQEKIQLPSMPCWFQILPLQLMKKAGLSLYTNR